MRFGNLTATYQGDIPPRTTKVIYCGVSIFRDACYQLVASFLMTYITFAGVLEIDPPTLYLQQILTINVIIIICRIWDGINDPMMGWFIEKFHFKWGKYKPWIFMGAVLNTGVVLTLFLARPKGWGFVALFTVFYLLWDVAWTINDIAYWSMLPSLTTNQKIRSNITAAMQVCISIGVFALYAVVPMLVGGHGVPAAQMYGIIASVVTILFLISQVVLVLTVKEHVRNPALEAKEHEAVRFKDMFTIFKKNDQFRINIIAILLNYLGGGVLVAFAMYYFYLMYGYGPDLGGRIQFIFTIMYAIGTLLAQLLFPLFNKFMSRKKMLIMSGIIFSIGYIFLFFLGFPLFGPRPLADTLNNLIWLLYICGVIIFFGQGIFAIIIIIQMQMTIEYNEYKFGERKESIVSSMRAFMAKLSSAIQQGLIMATLAATGLYAITSKMSDAENLFNAGLITDEAKVDTIKAAIDTVTNGQLVGLGIGMIVVPLTLLLVSLSLCVFVFKIDEKKYEEMHSELLKRSGS